jgi:hypothetical protein
MRWLLLPGVRAPVLTEQEAGYASASPTLLSIQKLLSLPGVKLHFHVHPAHGIVHELSCPAYFFLSLLKKKNCIMCVILVNLLAPEFYI